MSKTFAPPPSFGTSNQAGRASCQGGSVGCMRDLSSTHQQVSVGPFLLKTTATTLLGLESSPPTLPSMALETQAVPCALMLALFISGYLKNPKNPELIKAYVSKIR